MILTGHGRLKLDTTHFTEQEFKSFAHKHGIPLGNKAEATEVVVDTTRPPKAFYHKAGREPVEHDPKKMRDGARSVWEKFAATTKPDSRKKAKETQIDNNNIGKASSIPPMKPDTQLTSDNIIQKGKMIRLENSMKKMKDSQEDMERTTNTCQEQIINMTKRTEDSIDRMSEMITKMGDSITIQNHQLEAQAKAQVKQAEDIQHIMDAIHAISNVVQAKPTPTQDDDGMQIDIPQSNYNKRKQTSIGLTTPFTDDTQESIMTPPNKAESLRKGVHNARRQ